MIRKMTKLVNEKRREVRKLRRIVEQQYPQIPKIPKPKFDPVPRDRLAEKNGAFFGEVKEEKDGKEENENVEIMDEEADVYSIDITVKVHLHVKHSASGTTRTTEEAAAWRRERAGERQARMKDLEGVRPLVPSTKPACKSAVCLSNN